MAVRVKVCGVTSLEDARTAVAAGADALGINLWPKSVRRCDEQVARDIVQALGGQTLFVGVFVDEHPEEIARLVQSVGLGCVQLHGDEPPEQVQRFLPHAYKALRVRSADVLAETRRYPGEYVLLDAYVKGMPGGTGEVFDWAHAREVARERKLVLAGGLTADNVADAVRAVQPWCVDTASGVERAPGIKDPRLVAAFVAHAKGAA